jgi:hypothetical protein
MKLELIPVIEIKSYRKDVLTPKEVPYWENPMRWDQYNAECFKLAGFKDKLEPYFPGSSFYRISEITLSNLSKIVLELTHTWRDENFVKENCSPLSGGYVLRIDEMDKYFPQCCGDLSDFQHWVNLSKGEIKGFWAGHPEPLVRIEGDTISFDFEISATTKYFAPLPDVKFISFSIIDLQNALKSTKEELELLEKRLNKINQEELLFKGSICDLLIWDTDNFKTDS